MSCGAAILARVPGIWQDLEPGAAESARWARAASTLPIALPGMSRADASPRISPVKPYFAKGRLLVGAMTWSGKAADLLGDPR